MYFKYENDENGYFGLWEISDDLHQQQALHFYDEEGFKNSQAKTSLKLTECLDSSFIREFDKIDILTQGEYEELVFLYKL